MRIASLKGTTCSLITKTDIKAEMFSSRRRSNMESKIAIGYKV